MTDIKKLTTEQLVEKLWLDDITPTEYVNECTRRGIGTVYAEQEARSKELKEKSPE